MLLLSDDDVTADDVTLTLNAAMTSGRVTSSAVSDSCHTQVISVMCTQRTRNASLARMVVQYSQSKAVCVCVLTRVPKIIAATRIDL